MNAPVTFLASGTRGDIQPYIALALGLRAAGVPVRFVTHPQFYDLVTGRGLACELMDANPSDLLIQPGGHSAMTYDGSLTSSLRATLDYIRRVRPLYARMLSSAWRACQGSRALVIGLATTWGAHIAEALDVRLAWAFLQPFARTRYHPSALLPVGPASWGPFNPLSQRLVEQATWQPWRALIDRWRLDELGLRRAPFWGVYPRLYAPGATALYGYSPLVAPRPPDWPPGHLVTGYWFLDPPPGWSPPVGLLDFLASGPPPLYIGFGSPGTPRPAETGQQVLRALQTAGLRGVLALPPDALPPGPLPPWVYPVADAPHAWLFPRLAAAVHHGGAGTTGAALRAGLPSLILPLAVDQFFWGRRIAALGAGPQPLPRRRLTVSALAERLAQTAGDPALRARAQALSAGLAAENGVSLAVEAVRRML